MNTPSASVFPSDLEAVCACTQEEGLCVVDGCHGDPLGNWNCNLFARSEETLWTPSVRPDKYRQGPLSLAFVNVLLTDFQYLTQVFLKPGHVTLCNTLETVQSYI